MLYKKLSSSSSLQKGQVLNAIREYDSQEVYQIPSSYKIKEKALNMQEKLQYNNLKFLFAKYQLFLEGSVTVPSLIHYYTNNAKLFQWNNYSNMALSRVSQCKTSGS